MVKRTWRVFREIDASVIGDAFYTRLFAYNPMLRKMFPKNMSEQYQKLMDMISAIVSKLERLDEISEDITAMARRHINYGVRPAHYKLVGRALLWTLQQGLGKDWNAEVETAWKKCYDSLSEVMIAASSTNLIK